MASSLLDLATAAANLDTLEQGDEDDDSGGESSGRSSSSSRKTRPTRTAYQKAVLTRCAQQLPMVERPLESSANSCPRTPGMRDGHPHPRASPLPDRPPPLERRL